MKKLVIVLSVLFITVVLCGCNKNNVKETKEVIEKSNVSEKKVAKYKIDFKNDNKKINDKLNAKIVRVVVTNDDLKDEAKKINNYLDEIIDKSYSSFKEYVTDTSSSNQGYTFSYVYSLLDESDNYLIFKLDYEWQAGGPYPVSAQSFYMFNKLTGDVVSFDDLFTDNVVADKVYSNLVEKVENLYTNYDDVYDAESSGLEGIIKDPGQYVLVGDKLSFVLPRGNYTVAAYGTITIDIDKEIYKDYIK